MQKVSISNATLIMWRVFGIVWVLGCFSACQSVVPASTPPQLQHTPSVPITITHSHIESDWFTLDYPDNWRVITNIATEPLHLILVSPDDALIIHIEDAREGCIVQSIDSYSDECVGENGTQLSIWGEQVSELQAEYDAILESIVNSVTFR